MITADEIRSYPLSTDRKGYSMEEVDTLLDTVAETIEELNAQIDNLRFQLESKVDLPPVVVPQFDENAAAQVKAEVVAEFEEKLAEASADAAAVRAEVAGKQARIAELEAQLANAKADGNAIAQALIIAQRSADEILTNANAQAVQIIDDAKEDAAGILARAEEDKQAVLDQIATLTNDREDARAAYSELLQNFIADAAEKLASITDKEGAHEAAVVAAPVEEVVDPSATGRVMSKAQIPVRQVSAETYVTPQFAAAVPVAATPTPSKAAKDLSGFGDVDSDFPFDDID